MQIYGADKVWKQMNRERIAVARCTAERWLTIWRYITGALTSHAIESIHAHPEDSKLPRGRSNVCQDRGSGLLINLPGMESALSNQHRLLGEDTRHRALR